MTQSSGGGFQVEPDQLTKFANYLTGTTGADFSKVASDVNADNGGDISAFGVLLGQVFAIPMRIDLAIVKQYYLDSTTKLINSTVSNLQQTASQYTDTDSGNAASFQAINPNEVNMSSSKPTGTASS